MLRRSSAGSCQRSASALCLSKDNAMNFIDDLRTIAQRYLDYYEVDYRAEEDTRLIVERWINIKLKLIQPIPREVFVSKEIVSKSLSDEKAHAFNEIRFKFERE